MFDRSKKQDSPTMREKLIAEVERILREQLSSQDILKAVQAQCSHQPFGVDKLNPEMSGLSPRYLKVDPSMIKINNDNHPIFEIHDIYFTIPELHETKVKMSPFNRGLHTSHYVISGTGPSLTIEHSTIYNRDLDKDEDQFTIVNSSFNLQKVVIK